MLQEEKNKKTDISEKIKTLFNKIKNFNQLKEEYIQRMAEQQKNEEKIQRIKEEKQREQKQKTILLRLFSPGHLIKPLLLRDALKLSLYWMEAVPPSKS